MGTFVIDRILCRRRNCTPTLAVDPDFPRLGGPYPHRATSRSSAAGRTTSRTRRRQLAVFHKKHLGDAATGVAMLREVVAACARNPELGREYKHPNSSQSFAAELAQWERAL